MRLRIENRNLTEVLSENDTDIDHLTSENNQMRSQLNQAANRIETLTANLNQAANRIETLTNRIDQILSILTPEQKVNFYNCLSFFYYF